MVAHLPPYSISAGISILARYSTTPSHHQLEAGNRREYQIAKSNYNGSLTSANIAQAIKGIMDLLGSLLGDANLGHWPQPLRLATDRQQRSVRQAWQSLGRHKAHPLR